MPESPSVIKQFTAEMAHAAVARGAEWLDKRCPEWVKEINLDELDMGDGDHCVLGQTATCLVPNVNHRYPNEGGFEAVLNWMDHDDDDDEWSSELGFDVPMDTQWPMESLRYEMLRIAWLELVRQRMESVQ